MAPNYTQHIPYDKRMDGNQSEHNPSRGQPELPRDPNRHLESDRSFEENNPSRFDGSNAYGRDRGQEMGHRRSRGSVREPYHPKARTPFHHPDQEDWYGEKGNHYSNGIVL